MKLAIDTHRKKAVLIEGLMQSYQAWQFGLRTEARRDPHVRRPNNLGLKK
jgi:hypothetical protein